MQIRVERGLEPVIGWLQLTLDHVEAQLRFAAAFQLSASTPASLSLAQTLQLGARHTPQQQHRCSTGLRLASFSFDSYTIEYIQLTYSICTSYSIVGPQYYGTILH